MNYQSFCEELTLISKNTYNFSMTTMRVYLNTTWPKVSTMSIKRFFMIIIDQH